jgi:predicted GNAT family N-acyltransferase
VSGVKDGVTIVETAYGSDLYAQALRLREEILRRPLGLVVTEQERADDALRRHFCAVAGGVVVGSVSLRPLGPHTLQLRQMAVGETRRGMRIGARLLDHAEAWGRGQGFQMIVLNARMGAEGFYAKFGYGCEGEPFEETTLPHIRMTKRLA